MISISEHEQCNKHDLSFDVCDFLHTRVNGVLQYSPSNHKQELCCVQTITRARMIFVYGPLDGSGSPSNNSFSRQLSPLGALKHEKMYSFLTLHAIFYNRMSGGKKTSTLLRTVFSLDIFVWQHKYFYGSEDSQLMLILKSNRVLLWLISSYIV